MAERLECDSHGKQRATYVCAHVIETLRDNQRRGFWWSVDEDGEYQAKCSECEQASLDMSEEDWAEFGSKVIRLLCLECYFRAASINKVDVERRI